MDVDHSLKFKAHTVCLAELTQRHHLHVHLHKIVWHRVPVNVCQSSSHSCKNWHNLCLLKLEPTTKRAENLSREQQLKY